MTRVQVRGGTFVVVSNGEADGPSQPLVRFLVEHEAHHVIVVAHPLSAEDRAGHRRVDVIDGVATSRPPRRLPNRPPFTYALDPLAPPLLPSSDGWFGFNCLATAQGLAHRRIGRTSHVIHWNVDYVPNRFGYRALTRMYERLDRACCRRADGRVELSSAALDARAAHYGLEDTPPVEIIPMGAWVDESPTTADDRRAARGVVFLGHLVERMGVDVLLDAAACLTGRGSPVSVDIVGGGPLLEHVRRRAREPNLFGRVTVHGFVADFDEVRRLVAGAAVGVAPYEASSDTFTRFADPGKLKAYLGAALPIVLTDVPPNARELADHAGAQIVEPDSTALADAIDALLADPTEWRRRHELAMSHRETIDWGHLFAASLPRLGIDV